VCVFGYTLDIKTTVQRIQGLVLFRNGVEMGWTTTDKAVYWQISREKATVTNGD
jgi:hypothetical protein